jgi:hypothetical protein
VSAQDFKSCGPDSIGTVGSIPTHFRQPPPCGALHESEGANVDVRNARRPGALSNAPGGNRNFGLMQDIEIPVSPK